MRSNVNGARRPRFGRIVRAAGKVGASRRTFTLVSALVVAVALAMLSSGAGAASKCEPISTTNFTDPVGDGNGSKALDIKNVAVTTWEGGWVSFQTSLVDVSRFSDSMLVQVFVDSDRNAATGDGGGYDYMIDAQRVRNEAIFGTGADSTSRALTSLKKLKCEDQPSATLFKWNGKAWSRIDSHTLSAYFSGDGLTVKLGNSEIGGALIFDFAVYAAGNVSFDSDGNPVLDDAADDWAPDTGSFTYQPFMYSTYVDPSGDGKGENAPDLTQIAVWQWAGGLTRFRISLPDNKEFAPGMLLQLLIDADRNPETGNAGGYDYMIKAQRKPSSEAAPSDSSGDTWGVVTRAVLQATCEDETTVALYGWGDSGWTEVETDSLQFRFDHGVKIALNADAIGDTKAFDFAVYAASNVTFDEAGNPDGTNASDDRAPDAGSYNFPLAVDSAELQGIYTVSYKITAAHNFPGLKRGAVIKRTWKFAHSCKKKHRCTTRVVVSGSRERFTLSRSGKALKAKMGKKVACSAWRKAHGVAKVHLKVKRGSWVKGSWRAAKWTGTEHVVSRSGACGGTASYSAVLKGTRR
jgi:hypothetical protein